MVGSAGSARIQMIAGSRRGRHLGVVVSRGLVLQEGRGAADGYLCMRMALSGSFVGQEIDILRALRDPSM